MQNARKLGLKGLTVNLTSRHNYTIHNGSKHWPAPSGGKPGTWVELPAGHKPVKPYFYGFHAAQKSAAASWLCERNFIIELDGEQAETKEIMVGSRARLVEELFVTSAAALGLCIDMLGDLCAYPRQIGYPDDQCRAIEDSYLRLCERFEINCRLPAREVPPSRWSYLPRHLKALTQLCEPDKQTTVERKHNVQAVSHLAQASLIALNLAGLDPVPGWVAIKQVAYNCREAAEQAVMRQQQLFRAGQIPDFVPALKQFAPDADIEKANAPEKIVGGLFSRQSARLLTAWGLDL